jgi:hypothetical protein
VQATAAAGALARHKRVITSMVKGAGRLEQQEIDSGALASNDTIEARFANSNSCPRTLGNPPRAQASSAVVADRGFKVNLGCGAK